MRDRKLDSWINADFNAKNPFLEQIPSALADLILRQGRVTEYDPGTIILRRGAVAEQFFVVQSGTVLECAKKHNGKYLEQAPLVKGSCFGEHSLLSGIPTTRVYVADGMCTLLVMDKPTFFATMIEAPGMLVVLYRILAERVSNRDKMMDSLLKPGVQGDLSTQGFMDIAQSFLNANKTGIVNLDNNGRKAVVGFNGGQLCYAKMKDCEGIPALDQIMTWEEGKFSYENTELIEEINIQGDTMGLLLDALRRLDEAAAQASGGDGFPLI
jgi:hypothetical protein